MTDMIVVVDTETSGLDPKQGAALLEVAAVVLTRTPAGGFAYGGEYCDTLVEHGGDVPPEVQAVHHIVPGAVRPGEPGVLPRADALGLLPNGPGVVYAAHNAEFDRKFLPELTHWGEAPGVGVVDRPWLDTWRCALHLYPDAPGHGNQVLRYYLGVVPEPELMGGHPHRALYDAATTAAVLLRMLGLAPVGELVRLSTQPAVLRTCRFGKHYGVPWADVPTGYLRWVLSQDFDADVLHTARHYLGG